ncbi:MAG TPA: sigma-70 family RNA polymerase sigma factor [Actinomycetota bacterium]|nr:sigma-70 family RNA polymerase sigma factor [Actinomycetota bacterium]
MSSAASGDTGSHDFEQQWPDLAKRLDTMLAGKRVPAHKRDDIVQETGLRLFRMWGQVDPERPLWALVVTIALNLLRDEARKHPEREVLGLVPDRAADQDVERAGLARLEWRRVQSAMTQLSPDHRSILMAELGDEYATPSRGPNATKMLRMRARRRLNALLDVASASGVLIGVKVRRLFDFERHVIAIRGLMSSSENLAAPAAAGFLSAVALFAAAAGPFAGDAGAGVLRERIGGSAANLVGVGAGAYGAAASPASGYDLHSERLAAPSDFASNRNVDAGGVEVTTGTGGAATKNKPFRAGTGDHWIEGGAEVGVAGMGVRVGDRGSQTPACLSPGSEGMLPPGYICSDGENTEDGVHADLKVGSDEHKVEVKVDVE